MSEMMQLYIAHLAVVEDLKRQIRELETKLGIVQRDTINDCISDIQRQFYKATESLQLRSLTTHRDYWQGSVDALALACQELRARLKELESG